jgi:hypothetical protein
MKMIVRLLPVLLLIPAAAPAADDNPYKDAKVGDFVKYKWTTGVGAITIAGTIEQTVIAKTDKEVTLKTVATVSGKAKPAQELKIDLTKPFNPTNTGNLPPGADVKVEKLKDGKEKVTAGGKEYDTAWTSYSVKGSVKGSAMAGETKVWTAKGVAGPVKIESKMNINDRGLLQAMTMTMEVTETGSK